MHLSIFPVALIDRAIGPFISALALHVLIHEIALIAASILPKERTMTMLIPILKSTSVLASIRENLGTLAMEETVSEVALKRVTICRVQLT